MGFAIGYGGVWVMAAPQHAVHSRRNADGVPDGPAQVVLDGFAYTGANKHTSANGLRFGIDGWIYGRVGHGDVDMLGAPGTPTSQRTLIRGSIFRYHPVTKVDRSAELRHRQPVGTRLGQVRRALLRLHHRRPSLVRDARREVRQHVGRAEPQGVRADRLHR